MRWSGEDVIGHFAFTPSVRIHERVDPVPDFFLGLRAFRDLEHQTGDDLGAGVVLCRIWETRVE
jgi:hypothetical protein